MVVSFRGWSRFVWKLNPVSGGKVGETVQGMQRGTGPEREWDGVSNSGLMGWYLEGFGRTCSGGPGSASDTVHRVPMRRRRGFFCSLRLH